MLFPQNHHQEARIDCLYDLIFFWSNWIMLICQSKGADWGRFAFDISALSNYSQKKLDYRGSLYEPLGGGFVEITSVVHEL